MIEIKNITFTQYFELDDKTDYDYCIKYAYSFNKSIDIFHIGDFTQLSFGIIKDIQYDLGFGYGWDIFFKYISLITGNKINELSKMKLIELCQAKKYMVDEIKRIVNIEKIILSYAPDPQEIDAGIEELGALGAYLQFRSLANSDITKIEQIRNMKYEECFLELVTQKKLSDYQEKLNEIKMKLNK